MGVVSLNEITPVSVWKWVCRRIFTHPDTVTHPMEKALMLKLVLGLSLIRPSTTAKMMLLVSKSSPQNVTALVTVLGTAAMFISFYIMCEIVYRLDWLVPLFAF